MKVRPEKKWKVEWRCGDKRGENKRGRAEKAAWEIKAEKRRKTRMEKDTVEERKG